ncbi:MAG: hypothetical protein R3229_15150 [Alphaproteobacteria bacterium]|nr:hypothetical protein [Alphaproteobacteria bacterium]
MRAVVLAIAVIVSAFAPALARDGGEPAGYYGFAEKAENGAVDTAECRAFGGQPVVDQHYHVVMRMGRRDVEHGNIIYYGGHQYVTFTIERSTFWGRTDVIVALCHFAG